jgi:hypothetical protein
MADVCAAETATGTQGSPSEVASTCNKNGQNRKDGPGVIDCMAAASTGKQDEISEIKHAVKVLALHIAHMHSVIWCILHSMRMDYTVIQLLISCMLQFLAVFHLHFTLIRTAASNTSHLLVLWSTRYTHCCMD